MRYANNAIRLAVIGACTFGGGLAQAEFATIEDAGKARYMDTCAVCHGEDAKGKGLAANVLSKAPTDLTLLSRNNGGAFPMWRVYDTGDSREMPGAHGMR